MSEDDLDLHAVIDEAQRHAPACYKLGISFIGPWERGMPPKWLTLSVSLAGSIIEWEAIKTAGATHGSIVSAFERLIRCAIVAKIRDDNAPVASTVYAMTANKSRAERLLAELDCHVDIDQRADAIKAIEAYLVDAYEAGWHDEPSARTPEELRANAEAYTSDPEQP